MQPWIQSRTDYIAAPDPHADVGHCPETSHLVADEDRRPSLKRQEKGSDFSVTAINFPLELGMYLVYLDNGGGAHTPISMPWLHRQICKLMDRVESARAEPTRRGRQI